MQTLKPRILGEVVYGTKTGEAIRDNFRHIGTGGLLGNDDTVNGDSKSLLILPEDLSGYTWLTPAMACAIGRQGRNCVTLNHGHGSAQILS